MLKKLSVLVAIIDGSHDGPDSLPELPAVAS